MAKANPDANMPLGDHLEELRKRLTVALYGLIPLVVISLIVGRKILGFIMQPALDALVATGYSRLMTANGPLEGFGSYIKVSLLVTLLVGSPWILFQLWRFVAPGLYAHERRFVYFLLPLSAILTVLGVAFLYFFIMPMLLRFFLDFGSTLGATPVPSAPVPEGVHLSHIAVLPADPPDPAVGDEWINTGEMLRRTCVAIRDGKPVIYSSQLFGQLGLIPMYRVSEYVQLLLSLSLAFAAAFQTPVVVLLLGWAGIIDRKFLSKYRKHAILVCAIAAALLTPGDPASMILMLIPLYLLYELGGILLKYFPASRVAGEKPPGPEEQPDAREPVAASTEDQSES
jgi:sec-independent protein translocase protein TatC